MKTRPTVYLVTNTVNGKGYVGATRVRLTRRWRGHVQKALGGVETALGAAIRKYGEAAFTVEAVAFALSVDDLERLEEMAIASFATLAPMGYNLTTGGYGAKGLLPEARARAADKNRGRRHTEEAKRRIGEARLGHEVTPETRALIAAGHRGKTLTPEHRAKLSAAKRGKTPRRTEEHREKLRAILARARATKAEKCAAS